jgi:hypothetical protein
VLLAVREARKQGMGSLLGCGEIHRHNTGELFIDSLDFLDDVIFADGFEGGTTAAWSETAP